MAQHPRPAAQAGPAPSAGGLALDPIRLLRKYWPVLVVAAVLGAVLGGAAHMVLRQTSPVYTASATFAVYPQQGSITQIGGAVMAQDELLRFTGTQMALMVSPAILERVLTDADVENTKWASQFKVGGRVQTSLAKPELEKALSVRGVPSTNLIRVSMTTNVAEEARRIVDALVRVYQDDLRSQEARNSVERRQVLGGQITALDQQIAEKNQQRDRIMESNRIGDLNATESSENIKTARLSEEMVRTQSDLSTARSRLDRNQKMMEENAVIPFPDDMREMAKKDPVVLGLEQQIASYRTDYNTLRAQGYGEEHPTVVAVRKRIDATTQERDEVEGRVLSKLFASEVDGLKGTVDALTSRLETLAKDLDEVSRRKEDLVRLRVRIGEIEEDTKRLTIERAELEAARKNMELIGQNRVFDRVRLIVPAETPGKMSFPKWEILIPLGLVLLTGLTAGVVLIREVLDQRVRGPADLALITRLRTLGLVTDAAEDPARPSNVATAFRDAASGVTAESFRLLRTTVMKAMDQAGHKSLLVLAGNPGSGATSVVCNLGLACAGSGERVLIIDGNLRRPGVHKVFGISDGPGLGDCLNQQVSFESAVRETGTPGLSVLTAGSPSSRSVFERLSSEAMGRLMAEATGRFDRVIVDSSPAIVSGDGMAMANRVHATLLVVRAMGEKRGLVNRLRNQLTECRGEFLGVVVNAVRASAGGYLKGNIKTAHEYGQGGGA